MHLNFADNKTILITIDVEDWFQVENFKEYIPYSSWSSRELRVEKNTCELLDLFDDVPTTVRATFFVLGWVAERCPDLICEIHKRGHEVASHGVNHHLCYRQDKDDLRIDLIKSKELLEDIIGSEVSGYRAPSFSITDEALGLVREAGYLYDSSYNSFEGHSRYGSLRLPEKKNTRPSIYSLGSSFYEIPVSNLKFGKIVIPWGGGGYFRLLPSFLHKVGVKQILKQNGCYTFYIHPWEIDPGQPKVKNANRLSRFRHYVNLDRTMNKLEKLLVDNHKYSFQTCREFIKNRFNNYA